MDKNELERILTNFDGFQRFFLPKTTIKVRYSRIVNYDKNS